MGRVLASDHRRFDAWSRTYERSLMQTVFFGPVQGSVLAAVGRYATSGRALDLGCGTGRLLARLESRFPGAVGLDYSLGMLEAGRRARPGMRVVRGGAERLPYPDESFDVVTTTVSFHHWTDKIRALTEVRRVLRPGGIFVLADPAPDDIPGWQGPLRRWVRRDRHMVPLDDRHRLIEEAGLRVREVSRALHGRWVPLTLAERPAG